MAKDTRRRRKRTVLWVDDERFALTNYKTLLEQRGFEVHCAYSFSTGKKLIKQHGAEADLVIIDVMMPLGEVGAAVSDLDSELVKGGYESGVVLAHWTRENFPDLRIMAYSASQEQAVGDRLKSQGILWLSKATDFRNANDFVMAIQNAIDGATAQLAGLRTFIVHGHDEIAKWKLKNYLQNILGLPEPRILHEQPSRGRTIIEKFEEEAADRNLVFVLLTGDDKTTDGTGAKRLRARQNVIFELGYFVAKLGRRNGRVILLHKGGVEVPSDLSGIVYIDISNGIEAAGEAIRNEVKDLCD